MTLYKVSKALLAPGDINCDQETRALGGAAEAPQAELECSRELRVFRLGHALGQGQLQVRVLGRPGFCDLRRDALPFNCGARMP